MQKPEYVYHGGARELIGNALIPRKARDLGDRPANKLQGVYASDLKDLAIAKGILSCKGVGFCSCGVRENKVRAIVYSGWPQQEFFYLYTLSSLSFENIPEGSHQWISLAPVKPEKIERFLVTDYLYLVRKPTNSEIEEWKRKYGDPT